MSILDSLAGTATAGTLYGIGVGPGDARYLTLRAAGLVQAVDVVAYFAKIGSPGNARRIVAPLLAEGRAEMRLEYPVTDEVPADSLEYQQKIGAFYRQTAETLAALLRQGKSVGLLAEGDPFFYGSFMHMWRRLSADFPVEVVPGVTGMSGCWTRANLPMTWGNDALAVLPGTLDEHALVERLRLADAAVIMKVGRNLAKVRRAVRGADIVVTMLPADQHVEAVVLGEDGVLAHLEQGALLIDFSTIRPETSQRIAKAGTRVLDAPVSGGQQGAIDGVLSIMAGGTQADFDAAKPVFDAVGKVAALVGPAGAGQFVKAANQLVVGGTYALVAEAILLMEASGVDARAGLDVLAGGLAGSRILELKRESMLARDFTPGFRIDLHHKDMGIVLDAARQAEVALPFGFQVAAHVQAARAAGLGDRDHSGLLAVAERFAGREER